MSPAEQRLARAADLAECSALLRHGSRSFYMASRLLPVAVRDAATALYAFCRAADDEVDVDREPGQRLVELERRLTAIYAGRPDNTAVDRAMAAVVEDYSIPRALPAALLEGFAWDIDGRRYDSLSDVRAYAARVAGSVGAMMALIMGARSPEVLARACELGVAMQLTNIARDVGEDAANGRLYLPGDWLRDAGIDPDDWCRDPVFEPRIGEVVRRLLGEAHGHYMNAETGISELPPRCRAGIRSAARIYAGIGSVISDHSYDSVSSRAVLSRSKKLAIIARAVKRNAPRRFVTNAWAVPETRFLVDAVAARRPRPMALEPTPAWWNLRGQGLWVLELFDTLERRRRLDTATAQSSTDVSDMFTGKRR